MARRDAAGVRLRPRFRSGRRGCRGAADTLLPDRRRGHRHRPERAGGVRLIRGHRPSAAAVLCAFDLIEASTATEVALIINLKTAKALRLTMPTTLLVTADEVIE
jgi:hypothetical protein